MSRGPSLTALLGLLAIAGYQNRDKIADMMKGLGGGAPAGQGGAATAPGGLGGLLGGLGGGTTAGGLLSGGLGELMDRFKEAGQHDVADSWVRTGPNQPVSPPNLERAIGPDVLATLSAQTGLSKEELLKRLSQNLPQAVDQYTPDGRLPMS